VFALVATCTRCGQENPEGAKFCNACAAPLAEPGRRGEERRIVSILFVDLVGFTTRSEQLDPEDVRAFLTPYYERVRSELERFGGNVEKFIGDAVMGVFGAPVAYGDDAERAVRAAFAVRDWSEQEGLELRIAVNTGEAIVELDARPGHGEAMVAGDVVNTAARLQAAAPAGAVIVGDETHAATRNAIEYRPAQPVIAKGKEMPVGAWLAMRAITAVGERHVAHVQLVGRERELGVLTGIWERVLAEGKSQSVTVFGASGIGKSRIALELAQLVGTQGGRVIRGRSTPYGASSPYSAFAQQVKQVASIFDSDDAAEAYAKLTDTVAALAGPAAAEEHVPQLATLLGLDVENDVTDRDQLFFSARVLVESLALKGPTLLLYDDIHWADASLLDLLETLAARVRDVPVLFLALSRPELLGDRPGWGGGLPAYTTLPLDQLSEAASVELAEAYLGAGDEAERAAAVASTAEGNPLFIEELAVSLVEQSTLGSALPTSVRAIVAARLDSLPAPERGVLVDASVVGRVFWRGALSEIAARDDLPQLLGSLEARDLVQREAVSRIKGDQQYAFKHGLIHEVAYATLPRAARRSRHEAVAHFLEAANVGGVSREALGHHWREAGDADRAFEQLVLAGDQAGRGWAKKRAVALYREALALLSEDDERRREVSRNLAVALQAVFHLEDARRLQPGE
jgi:class 3 adenylate cyclase/energy-coupling factor transporter ATP-binding protein EcfA2